MNIKLLFLLIASSITSQLQARPLYDPRWNSKEKKERDQYFRGDFLKNTKKVRSDLIKNHNFQHVQFKTEDGYNVEGLWRGGKTHTIVVGSGWCEGNMENMATLLKIIGDNYNILFYNQRGRGTSGAWHHYWNLPKYTIGYENDVIAALKFAEEKTKGKLFYYSLCASAIHSGKALRKIENDQTDRYNNIKTKLIGYFVDSGIVDLRDTLNKLDTYMFKPKEKIGDLFKVLAIRFIINFILQPINFFLQTDVKSNLLTQNTVPQVPTCYIYSEDDTLASPKKLEQLIQKTPNKAVWKIEKNKSKHADHFRFQAKKFLGKFHDFVEARLMNTMPNWDTKKS